MGPRRRPAALVVATIAVSSLAACPAEKEAADLSTGTARAWLAPSSASAGVPRTVAIRGVGTDWWPGEVDVSFGGGVDVGVLLVDSTFHMRAQVVVQEGAALGPRDVTITWPSGDLLLHGAFAVEEGSVAVAPSRATLGETVGVEITGWQTDFQPGHTVVSFGTSVDVIDVEVMSSSRIRATVHVPRRSSPGPVDLVVYNPGAQVYTLAGGFFVDRDLRWMRITPDRAKQGQEITVLVEAEDASFEQDRTVLDLGTGVVVDQVTVQGPESLEADLRIGNNAAVGPRDVFATTDPATGQDEMRILVDGFSIDPVQADPLRARVSLSFGISRLFDPEECAFGTSVYASATFYEPNDFPCPPSGSISNLMAPPHFDIASTGYTMTGGATDCPAPKTFDAGPWIAYEGDSNTVVLERYVHPYNGRVLYRGVDLGVPDYATGSVYDLETPGGDLGWSELPPWHIEDVLATLPRDYQQREPDWCGLRHPLDDELVIEWDPADTYDESEMYLYLIGPAQGEGVPLMMVYPWDDGEFTFTPELLSFFTPGWAELLQSAYRQTRFDVPGSEVQNAGIGTSTLMWRAPFEFLAEEQ